MTGQEDDIEARFEKAVEYAAELLDEFKETDGKPQVAAVLDLLQDEYDAALRDGRGMEPRLVRWVVQHLIDTARFPPENRPDEYDPDAPGGTSSHDPPMFRFVQKLGRPFEEKAAATISFTVGAVAERFGLHKLRNAEPALGKPRDGKLSATDAVAEAQKRRKGRPASYDGVRDAVGRAPLALGDGLLRGKYDARAAGS